MLDKIKGFVKNKKDSNLIKNGFWGLAGNLGKNVLLSLFYLMVARHYSVDEFSKYLIASTIYQSMIVFSSMGLGQWFIREVVSSQNRNLFVKQFLKMQVLLGIAFFFIAIALAFNLYKEMDIRLLSVIFAGNIIFDNIINCVKDVNIAEFQQIKTSKIIVAEAFIKFLIGASLFIYPFSIYILVILLVLVRIITLNIFLKVGTSNAIEINGFLNVPVSFEYFKSIISKNWAFLVIGSTYIIYWRIATIIISKTLPIENVTYYENSFKLFSLAQLVPMVFGVTVFPKFVEYSNSGKITELRSLYTKMFWMYALYGMLVYTFMFSFADILIPFLFGEKYGATSIFTKEMFITFLIFPTSVLQAQILVALKKEKLDMWYNINSFIINTTLCLIGLYFYPSLSVVNYSIFISFLIFHISQDVSLYKNKVSGLTHIFTFIGLSVFLTSIYILLSEIIPNYLLYILFWLLVWGGGLFFVKQNGIFHFNKNEQ